MQDLPASKDTHEQSAVSDPQFGPVRAKYFKAADAHTDSVTPPLDAPLKLNLHYRLLSNRTRKRLCKAGILSLADLIEWDEPSLLGLRGLGANCLVEINAFLEANDLLPILDAGNSKASVAHGTTGYESLAAEVRDILKRAGIHSGEDLQETKVQDLLGIPGIGTRTIDELISVGVVPRVQDEQDLLLLLGTSGQARTMLSGTTQPYINNFLDALARCRKKVEEQVLRGVLHERAMMDYGEVRTFNQGLLPPAQTLPNLLFRMQYLANREASSIVNGLDKALDLTTVEDELSLMLSLLDKREMEVLRARFALGERPTLDGLGARFGVSRERVRQIETHLSKRLTEAYYWELPLLRMRTAMLLVRQSKAVSLSSIFNLLRQRGLVASDESSVSDLLVAWRAINPHELAVDDSLVSWRVLAPEGCTFPERIISFAKTGLDPRQQTASPAILSAAIPMVRQVGAVTPSEVVRRVDDSAISEEDVTAVLVADGMREILPKYWARPVGKPVPHTVVTKMLSVCGPLNIRQLRRGLLRHQRRQGYPVASIIVLRAVLGQYEEFAVGQDDIVRLHGSSIQPTLGGSERVWLELVKQKGPVIHTDSIHRAFADNHLQPVTAYKLTRESALVERVDEQLFCLPGTQITDIDIASAREQALKIDANPTLTYDETGTATFETTAQQYMVRNGSLGSGPTTVLKGRWKTVVSGEEIGEFTVGQPWIYGLSEARDALKIQAGDRIRIRFDTWTRNAHVSVLSRGHVH